MALRAQKAAEPVKIRLKKNDTVRVLTGKDAGKEGKILKVIPEKNRVVVQGVGFIKRHTRPNPQRNIKGGIAEREAAIHASNVQVVCSECGKPTRIAHKTMDDGKKVRVCARRTCHGVLDR
jgi:large subunit ribosomal protein L24